MSAENIIQNMLSIEISGINTSNIDDVISRLVEFSENEKSRIKTILTEKQYPFAVLEGYLNGQNPRGNSAYVFEGNFSESENLVGQSEEFTLDRDKLGQNIAIAGRAETRIVVASERFYDCALLVKFIRGILIKLRVRFESKGLQQQNIASHEINYNPAEVNNLSLKAITFSYQQFVRAI